MHIGIPLFKGCNRKEKIEEKEDKGIKEEQNKKGTGSKRTFFAEGLFVSNLILGMSFVLRVGVNLCKGGLMFKSKEVLKC